MGVDKKILEQYVDACEMIRETEQDIKRLKRKQANDCDRKCKRFDECFPYARHISELRNIVHIHG